MSTKLLGVFIFSQLLIPPVAAQHQIWSHTIRGSAADRRDSAAEIAVGPNGETLVTGSFYGTVNLGGGDLVAPEDRHRYFLARFDSFGNHEKSRVLEGVWTVYDMAVDPMGNVYLAGVASIDQTSSGEFAGCGALPYGVGEDAFVAKFDNDGNCLWGKVYGDADEQATKSVVLDGAGNVFIAGDFNSSIKIGTKTWTSQGARDIYIASLDAETGNPQWDAAYGGTHQDVITDLYLNPDESTLFALGTFADSFSFGADTLKSAGISDVFILRMQVDGTPLAQSKTIGGPDFEQSEDMVITPAGDAYYVAFHGVSYPGHGFIMKFAMNDDRAPIWSVDFASSDPSHRDNLLLDASENLIVSGSFIRSMTVNHQTFNSAGLWDLFLMTLRSEDGEFQRPPRTYGGSGLSQAVIRGTALNPVGDLLISGYFQGTLNLGGEPLQNGELNVDGFFALMGLTPTANTVENLIACSDGSSIELRWALTDFAADLLTGVDIERGLSREGPFILLAELEPQREMYFNDVDVEPGTTYFYRLHLFPENTSSIVEAMVPEATLALAVLSRNDGEVEFRYSLPSSGGHASLEIYDVRGRLIHRFSELNHRTGTHTELWNGRIHSGAYFAVLRNGVEKASRKFVVLR